MIILGITMGIGSSCCIMVNGKVVAAEQEERITRIKNYDTWPKNAINSCLKIAGIKTSDIDKVVWAGEDPPEMNYFITKRYSSYSLSDMVNEQNNYWFKKMFLKKKLNYLETFKKKIDLTQAPGKKILQKYINLSLNKKKKFEKNFKNLIVQKELGIEKNKIECVEHHECHAYYSISRKIDSKKKFIIFTIDGSGDKGINSTVSLFKNKKLKRIYSTKKFIVGRIYRHITLFLGMKWGEHEYKTMGLAPYAVDKYSNGPLDIFKKSLKLDFNKKNFFKINLKDCYFSFFKPLSIYRFDGIAGGVQRFAEEIIVKWFNYWIKKKKIFNLSYSGGVSMNVKVNNLISNINSLKTFEVPGTGTDDSLSIGACYAYSCKNNLKVEPLKNLYLGNRVSDLEIKKLIKNINKNKYSIKSNINNLEIAKLLKKGLIIGRCFGRMEFGARALGNRSILADPRYFNTIKKINKKIKSRDFWMPFAPSVLDKKANTYFKINKGVDYTQMTVCVETKEKFKNIIPAVLHPADSTARIHLVKRELNKEYYDLLKSFSKISGIGILLNTSLNLHGKPIAKNAEDCYEILENSEIDGIQIEDYLILKKRK